MTWKLGEPDFVKKFMPVDSFKFSIIRDPVTHLTSSWKYFFNTQSYMPPSEKADILVKRLNKPEEFYKQLRNDTYLPHYRFYLRSQLFRQGFKAQSFHVANNALASSSHINRFSQWLDGTQFENWSVLQSVKFCWGSRNF